VQSVLRGRSEPRTTAVALGRVSTGLLGALLLAAFLLALTPRSVGLQTYVTADEDNWMRRAGGFAYGLSIGRLGRTFQSGHPGVLTMELAILGQGLAGATRFADPVTGQRVVTRVDGFAQGLVEARRAFVVASALLVAAIVLLVTRLWGLGVGALAGLLLALDPFFLAHSQLVHMDAILTGLMTLATLAALVCWAGGGRRSWLIAAGACSGLAVITKAPGAYLALALPLLGLALGRRAGWRALSLDLGVLGVSALVAFVLFWPAIWVAPFDSLARMAAFVRETGGEPHEQGNFFLGQPVVDPGPLFYPVAIALRLGPATCLGLLLLVGLAIARRLPAFRPGARLATLGVLGVALGFLVVMTLGPKKFDRYVLPLFPVLDLFAALGYWSAWRVLTAWRRPPLAVTGIAAALLVLLAVQPALSVAPYYLAYYNPLAGGSAAAVRTLPVGYGEGIDLVANYLNAKPNARNLTVYADRFEQLQATFVGTAEALRDEPVPRSANYVVLYLFEQQLGHAPRASADYRSREPEFVARINGIDYARVYPGPRAASGS
jgi:hypothetical protein